MAGTDCDRWLRSAREINKPTVDLDESYASVHNDVLLFAGRHRDRSSILVSTSTAGGRSSTHEITGELLAVVLGAIRAGGFAGQLTIADGAAFGQRYEDECVRLGYDLIASQYRAEILDLNRTPSISIGHGWQISRPYLDADCRVNLVKAKTHRRFGSSLSLKSVLAAVSGGAHGYPKLARGHEWVPWIVSRLNAGEVPTFCVVDGIRGVEGEGPMGGVPTRSSFVVSGESPVSVDIQGNIEMGFDPTLVPLLLAHALGKLPADELNDVGDRSSLEFEWRQYRQSAVDFLPARNCYWLYRSLRRSRSHPRRRKAVERLITDILRQEPESLRET